MSSNKAIVIDHLSKCYQIYDKPHYRLLQMMRRGQKQYYREHWAVKDISLEIGRGETFGIIGRNGSGKSTLLKMICGTLNPTSGTIKTQGRIAAILELGSGFNPEFTGRENVYMKGSILGLNSEEIDERFASIAEFAEIGDFMDQPVRTYSSGMMVRLAFAVSVNVDPEILVVDEALSVGDERFQRKCFSRIETIRDSGSTILFVSHSGGTVVQLCDRAALLDDGEKIIHGVPKEIYGRYQQLLYAPEDKRESIRNDIMSYFSITEVQNSIEKSPKKEWHEFKSVPNEQSQVKEYFDPNLMPSSTIKYESRGATINCPMILNEEGERVNNLIRGRRYNYVYHVKFNREANCVRFGMLIKTMSGVELGGAVSAASKSEYIPMVTANMECKVEFNFRCSLNPGSYFLNAGCDAEIDDSGYMNSLHRLLDAAMFKVQPEKEKINTAMVDFDCKPKVETLFV